MLQQVTLFDVYVGEQVGRGKKSLAYALEFQPKDRTLTVHEIDAIIAEIVSHVQQSCRATLRASAAIRSVSAQ
jgi:phenylalanyl-tRNA synthetase beta chain